MLFDDTDIKQVDLIDIPAELEEAYQRGRDEREAEIIAVFKARAERAKKERCLAEMNHYLAAIHIILTEKGNKDER